MKSAAIAKILLPLVAMSAAVSALGQAPLTSNSSAPPPGTPVFRSNARLVLVDVAVSDKKGQFVTGLKASDFKILEDGKPQAIKGFSVHVASVNAAPLQIPQLPPHQYTNFPVQDPAHAINIVLLDMLNTPFNDQAYARQQMLKFLAALPPGQTVALFALGKRLSMIQGFTGDSTALVNAAKSLLVNNSASHLTTTEAERQDTEITAANISAGARLASPLSDAIVKELAAEEEQQEIVRAEVTVQALQVLARSVSGYNGRKNLLWLSSEFPWRPGPRFDREEQERRVDISREEFLKSTALLSAAQIAVYPISITGLSNVGLAASVPTIVNGGTTLRGELDKASSRQVTQSWDREDAMTEIARETGGEAFYGSNDIKSAIASGIQSGSNYYTLAYTPQNGNWNSEYRKIEVKTAAGGLQLRFRHGYYAVPDRDTTDDEAAKKLASAMQPTVPESTMLLLRVLVLPPDKDHKTVRIDYAVDANDIGFSDGDDHLKHASVDFMAVAWDGNLKNAGYTTDMIAAHLEAEKYRQILQTGFPAHQELDLKPGSYKLRLGVIDRATQKVGTVDVPLVVTEASRAEK